jgi:hypothetical protein
MNTTRNNWLITLKMTTALGLLLCVPVLVAAAEDDAPAVSAAAAGPMPMTSIELVRQRIERLETTALETVEPLPEGETRELRAMVMYTHGRSQWRPGADDAWKDAAIDDVLPAGSMIRTGLKSALTLRVGLNATILVDSNARVTLPRIAHDGATLETAIRVERGQADIKVNRVGLTNDFSVVTPTGALAVKGTGFACQYDAFNGTSIVGSRTNMMNAIEVHYYATKLAFYLSGGAVSSNDAQNPTLAALIEASPPPSTNKAEQQDTKDQQGTPGQAIASSNPISQTVRIDLAIQQENRNTEINTYIEEAFLEDLAELVEAEQENQEEAEDIYDEVQEEIEEEVEEIDDPYDVFQLPGFEQFNLESPSQQGMLAAAIWFDLINESDPFYSSEDIPGLGIVPVAFLENLSSNQSLNYTGGLEPIIAAMDEFKIYGYELEEVDDRMPGPQDLRVVLAIVDEFCKATYPGDAVKIQLCRDCYTQAVYDTFTSDTEAQAYFQNMVGNLNNDGPGGISP